MLCLFPEATAQRDRALIELLRTAPIKGGPGWPLGGGCTRAIQFFLPSLKIPVTNRDIDLPKSNRVRLQKLNFRLMKEARSALGHSVRAARIEFSAY